MAAEKFYFKGEEIRLQPNLLIFLNQKILHRITWKNGTHDICLPWRQFYWNSSKHAYSNPSPLRLKGLLSIVRIQPLYDLVSVVSEQTGFVVFQSTTELPTISEEIPFENWTSLVQITVAKAKSLTLSMSLNICKLENAKKQPAGIQNF